MFRTILLTMLLAACLAAATHEASPGLPLQPVLDAAAPGDVVVLADGVYHEALVVRKRLTLRARNPGEATLSNRHPGPIAWTRTGERIWCAEGIGWPVHRLLVEGVQAFDYRNRANFEERMCGPFWSKGWQAERKRYANPPLSFAAEGGKLWLRLADDRDPNRLRIDFNGPRLAGRTLVQKDLGTAWNQQEIVEISAEPPVHPIIHWYEGTPERPASGRTIDFPKGCGIVVDIRADGVVLEGLRLLMAPTVCVEVNDSCDVRISDCYFSGYQFALNTGYRCQRLTVEHCEMDGGRMVSVGKANDVTDHMWNHSTYVIPVKFNGVGLRLRHSYIYEGYDLLHPRGRHKQFSDLPDLPSEVACNVWAVHTDNAFEFDAVEARVTLRAHHNLVLSAHDTVAITTTEDGGPLVIDHNLFWPGGHRIMKLDGTGRPNRGVRFLHNTYFTGGKMSANTFSDSLFENNIVVSTAAAPGWTRAALGEFLPTRWNLLPAGQRFSPDFTGPTGAPGLGITPATCFIPQPGSPAIDAGRPDRSQFQDAVRDGRPDLGAIEAGTTVDDWRAAFGHCGPRWISAADAARKAPLRPAWPAEIDPRWGGLD